jgi:hypothetical protein
MVGHPELTTGAAAAARCNSPQKPGFCLMPCRESRAWTVVGVGCPVLNDPPGSERLLGVLPRSQTIRASGQLDGVDEGDLGVAERRSGLLAAVLDAFNDPAAGRVVVQPPSVSVATPGWRRRRPLGRTVPRLQPRPIHAPTRLVPSVP